MRAFGLGFPPLHQQAMNAAVAAGRVVVAVIQYQKVFVPPEVEKEREAICQVCEENKNGRCKKCGCGVRAQLLRKTNLATEQCPLTPPKWARWRP